MHSMGAVPDKLIVLQNQRKRLGHWLPKTEPLFTEAGAPRWIEHPTLGARADVVALPLTQTDDVELIPYDPICREQGGVALPGPSEIVSVVGFPFGLSSAGSLAIWATGFVASDHEIDFDGLPVFLVDCRTRPGQSGSAVIAYRPPGMVRIDQGVGISRTPSMRFLGVYSGRINDQSDIGFVWKASVVADLVAAASPG